MSGRAPLVLALALASSALAGDAHALDFGPSDKPIRVDLTNTTIAAQKFNARDGEKSTDQGYGSFIDKLNAILVYDRFTLGMRLEGYAFWLRPEDRDYADAGDKQNAIRDGASRYRNVLSPAKLWATYRAPGGLEITVGDSYLQLGRGLVLSLRRIDDLGVDNTLLGAKVSLQRDPIAITLAAGIANPARYDDATGRSLLLPKPVVLDPSSPQPLFGADRIIAAEVLAGRGLGVVLGTRIALLSRCAPYAYDTTGHVDDGVFKTPAGTCSEPDRGQWTSTLTSDAGPVARSETVINASQSLEIPKLLERGNLYVEAAVQRRDDERARYGSALYGAFTYAKDILTVSLEGKSYRNFYPLSASVNTTRASAFNTLTYSAPPTTEAINQDSMFGYYNTCVDGARGRFDARVMPNFLVYSTVGYAVTAAEAPGGGCNVAGRSIATHPDETTTRVVDLVPGFEWRFDRDRSWLFASAGGRSDVRETGEPYYLERRVEYDYNQRIGGPFTFELTGRHRTRQQDNENVKDGASRPWVEGEHYSALKLAPKWTFTQGVEYTTRAGLPTMYFNGAVSYRFAGQSDVVRVFVGQQRGGLRCVSGVCKVFPPFEGARAELTLRF